MRAESRPITLADLAGLPEHLAAKLRNLIVLTVQPAGRA